MAHVDPPGGEKRGDGDGDEEALEPLKDEVAREVGVDPDRYGGNVPAKRWGALGGHMVKRLIEKGKDALTSDRGPANGPDSSDGRRRP